jgi:hypothetical protein
VEKTCKTVSCKPGLSEDEYAQIEAEWQEQLELRKELKDKPNELKRYNEKLKKVMLYHNCIR